MRNEIRIRKNENQIILFVCKDGMEKMRYIFQLANNERKNEHIAIQFFRSRWNSTICLFVHIFTLFRCNYEYNGIAQITVENII